MCVCVFGGGGGARLYTHFLGSGITLDVLVQCGTRLMTQGSHATEVQQQSAECLQHALHTACACTRHEYVATKSMLPAMCPISAKREREQPCCRPTNTKFGCMLSMARRVHHFGCFYWLEELRQSYKLCKLILALCVTKFLLLPLWNALLSPSATL